LKRRNPVYYNNEPQFTADLLEAAEYGGITGDWSRYRAIERQLAAETALAVLAQAQARRCVLPSKWKAAAPARAGAVVRS
jgi:hypothetical protein